MVARSERKGETRVALVDDHTLVREGFARLVNEIEGCTVVLEAANGKEFIERSREQPIDIAVVDLEMPVMNGYRTIEWIHQHRPEVRSVVLTFDASDDALSKAIRSGARGYLLKTINRKELAAALDALRTTGYYHSELEREHHAANPEDLTSFERQQRTILERITPRQLDFLKLIGDPAEHTYPRIAEIMGVHPRTVDNYFQGLRDTFGIRSKTGMLLFAVKWGIVKV